MGGAVTGRGNTQRVPAEFNIGFDPEAAHVVFSSGRTSCSSTGRPPCVTASISTGSNDCLAPEVAQRAFLRLDFREDARVDDATGRPRCWSPMHSRWPWAWTGHRSRAPRSAMSPSSSPARSRAARRWSIGTTPRRRANAQIVLDVDQARFESLIGATLARLIFSAYPAAVLRRCGSRHRAAGTRARCRFRGTPRRCGTAIRSARCCDA